MTYDHLIEKLSKEQHKIMPEIDNLREEGKLPEDLDRAAVKAQIWTDTADKKLGPAAIPQNIPDIDPLSMFSNMLFEYKGMFNNHTREHIELYRECVQEMFDLAHKATI